MFSHQVTGRRMRKHDLSVQSLVRTCHIYWLYPSLRHICERRHGSSYSLHWHWLHLSGEPYDSAVFCRGKNCWCALNGRLAGRHSLARPVVFNPRPAMQNYAARRRFFEINNFLIKLELILMTGEKSNVRYLIN